MNSVLLKISDKIGYGVLKLYGASKVIEGSKKLNGIANINDFSVANLTAFFTNRGLTAPTQAQILAYHQAVQDLANCLNQFQGQDKKTLIDAGSKAVCRRLDDVPASDLTTIRTLIARGLGTPVASVHNDFDTRICRPIQAVGGRLVPNRGAVDVTKLLATSKTARKIIETMGASGMITYLV